MGTDLVWLEGIEGFDAVLSDWGIDLSSLYPPQREALPIALSGEDLVLSAPTASGKSLIAYLGILRCIREKGLKSLYIVPLKALAWEKYDDLKSLEKLGLRVGISTGDLDSSDPWLRSYDVIVSTSEKCDSLLRHRADWVHDVGIVIADEIHLLGDGERGPTLEVLLTKLRRSVPQAQIVALSATISNAEEIASWIGGKLVRSDWRPVPLRYGVANDWRITYDDCEVERVGKRGSLVESLVIDSIDCGGQVLVFVSSRRRAESLAERLARAISAEGLDLDLGENRFAAKLGGCLKRGAAFHHAGLTNEMRRAVEDGFREGKIKAIAATPTLAAGVNLPARRVIVKELYRYDPNFGSVPISVMEFKQMAGRAGRPKYDQMGEAILLTDKPWLARKYVEGKEEPVDSKLGSIRALRSHMLSLIATGFSTDERSLMEFISSTLFARQFDPEMVREDVRSVVGFLVENGMVERSGEDLIATRIGKRVSDLYIDPLSAVKLIEGARSYREEGEVPILHMVCSTADMPLLFLRSKDYYWVEAEALEGELLVKEMNHEWLLAQLKTALLLRDWMDERSEDYLMERYGVYPGDIRRIVEVADWLLYSGSELGRLVKSEIVSRLARLRMRVGYGIRDELIPLVSIRGVGRVRARILYDRGYRTLDDIEKASVEELSKLPGIGRSLAESIKKIEEGVDEKRYNNKG
jgi:helicase